MMTGIPITAFQLAHRFVGTREIAGDKHNPLIQRWLALCFDGRLDLPDETPWCSAFCQEPPWFLHLPRSKSARARSWLNIGIPVDIVLAQAAFDVVVLKRGPEPQPGPDVIDAPGHVGFFAGRERDTHVLVLGGNQGNAVTVARYPIGSILGIRRLLF